MNKAQLRKDLGIDDIMAYLKAKHPEDFCDHKWKRTGDISDIYKPLNTCEKCGVGKSEV